MVEKYICPFLKKKKSLVESGDMFIADVWSVALSPLGPALPTTFDLSPGYFYH